MTRHAIRVECPLPLPAARTVAEAVWGTHGVVEGADDANWSRISITSTMKPTERVDITTTSTTPRILEVASADRKLARTAALHLAMETHGRFL